MVFTVSPTDAQGMQEDEAQLLYAIGQATQGFLNSLNHHQLPQSKDSGGQSGTLRIQFGRRLIYGQMARGEFRNELNPDRIKALFDALQQPVTLDRHGEHYQGKVPAIEISNGGKILFRQERDGVVTVNQIQFQLEENIPKIGVESLAQVDIPEVIPTQFPRQNSSAPSAEETIADEVDTRDQQAIQAVEIAAYLINPLESDTPLYESVSVQGYQITQQGDCLSVMRGQELVLKANQGEVVEQHLTAQDWEVFESWRDRLLPQHTTQLAEQAMYPHQYTRAELEVMETEELMTVAVEQLGLYPKRNYPRIEPDILDGDAIIQDILDLQQRRYSGHVAEPKQLPPAIAVVQKAADKLPEGPTQQLLQTAAQAWTEQIKQGVQEGVCQGVAWLASRPDAIKTHQTARAALELFNRGYARTGEKAYSVGDFQVRLEGQNLYTLSSSQGDLLQFQASKLPFPGITHQSIRVLEKSDRLSPALAEVIQDLRRDKQLMPQGDLDVEAIYVTKTRQAEQTVQTFLRDWVKGTSWESERSQYRFDMKNGGKFLRITDRKDGRKVIYQRENGRVLSKLGAADFTHLERLATRMQQVEQQQSRSKSLKPEALEIS